MKGLPSAWATSCAASSHIKEIASVAVVAMELQQNPLQKRHPKPFASSDAPSGLFKATIG